MFNFRQKENGKKYDKQIWDEERILSDDASITKEGKEKARHYYEEETYPFVLYEDQIKGSKINEIRVLGIKNEYVKTPEGRKPSYEIERNGEVDENRKSVEFSVEVVTEEEKTYEEHNQKVFDNLSKEKKVLVLLASVKDRIVWPENNEVPTIPYEETRGNWKRVSVDDHETILENIPFPSKNPPTKKEIKNVFNKSFNKST